MLRLYRLCRVYQQSEADAALSLSRFPSPYHPVVCCLLPALLVPSSTPPTGTTTFLKIRWWVGTGLLATPTLAVSLWYSSPAPSALLPKDAVVHIVVAWAVGGLMAYLSDWTRRWVSSEVEGLWQSMLRYPAAGCVWGEVRQ